MDRVIFAGEIRIGDGCIHQQDFADALKTQRLTAMPKDHDGVKLVLGRPLRGKQPAIVAAAQKKGVPVLKVDDVLDAATGKRIVELLGKKAKLEKYESAALAHLTGDTKPARKPKATAKARAKKATKAA